IRRLARQQADGERPLPAWERIRDELDLLLLDASAARGLLLADELGLLDAVLPELAMCRGVEQGGFHHLDVLRHSLEALHQLVQGFPDADPALRWATLLHDIGKPATKARGEDDRTHFYGHARLGQRLAQSALARLREPQARIRRVGLLVRYHMLPLPKGERAARRFVHRRAELLPDLLELMIADREAARGPLASEANRQAYRLALAQVLAILSEAPERPPLLDGEAVMRLLAIGPGPRVGEALRLVREAEAVGDVATPEEAAELLRRYAAAQGWQRERHE
ncbi:MAG: HD domain-containing protein, partial [Deinococcales bacterium]